MTENITQQKTVKLFLLDGNPRGVKTIKMSNWNGRGYIVPRSELNKLFQIGDTEIQSNLESPCLYFLIGQSEEEFDKQKLYIGQTENIKNRIISHDKQKDFWNYLLFFVSTDRELNIGHIRYLETLCIDYAKQYKRCVLDNTQQGTLNSLSPEDRAFVMEFLLNIKTILSSIGYRFLEPIVEVNEPQQDIDKLTISDNIDENAIFYLKKKNVNSKGMFIPDGFVVLSGSVISKKGYEINKIFMDKVNFIGDSIKTTEDIIFTSPSQASTMILGYPDNGRDSWKDKEDKSIKEKSM
ncbi:MAG: GIY-YIG nuclease family protein [Elusimicrobia bacterium]|nr:GIY-YIG nuclease family protein [Elusimicrobiota bacterium]